MLLCDCCKCSIVPYSFFLHFRTDDDKRIRCEKTLMELKDFIPSEFTPMLPFVSVYNLLTHYGIFNDSIKGLVRD